ncbi:acyl-CoA ligase (AMP-forming), exosortase A system-associated [Pseudomonas sp.]|uniref:acyl-CoA ligase (AMP-forming), exosortase A system-associated n=1 Tax=Pseudomonas sp. TaxID=306 RepID=UPI002729CD1C|nr:acyl-CoA ligase (AMP-forming), exosortase A system-associated [Pseudomonas sp.]
MLTAVHQLLAQASRLTPDAPAVLWRDQSLSFGELQRRVEAFAGSLQALGVQRGQRVAVYLPKQFETLVTLFGASRANAVFIPVNPQLKPAQVGHILRDAEVSWLVTSAARARQLKAELQECGRLEGVVLSDALVDLPCPSVLLSDMPARAPTDTLTIDADLAALFYTSGSTGKPKGVMVSHRNLLVGAQSVASYLCNTAEDRLLAVLPLSFDYGFSQLTTAFLSGACVALLEYLTPRDVIRAIERYAITGLAGVPPLWQQLAAQDWPEASRRLRYFTNSGGHLPDTTLARLRAIQPQAQPVLMYGLTEAFRSTWLPAEWLERKPGSMGIAIPNAEILVVRADGSLCDVGEPGELVHRGSLVSMGYWNDPERTAQRFRPLSTPHLPLPEIVVWSGDQVYRDADGFLFFLGRIDEQIKCSGYRISPEEIEEVVHASQLVNEVVVIPASHPELGQAPVALLRGDPERELELREWLRARLPGYMQPQAWVWLDSLPRNANGKYDRTLLRQRFESVSSSSFLPAGTPSDTGISG